MTIWAERVFHDTAVDDCDAVQTEFAEIFSAVGSPPNMMLMTVETEAETQLIAELPHPALLRALDGFERIDAKALPDAGELVVGWEDEFERQFRYQTASAI